MKESVSREVQPQMHQTNRDMLKLRMSEATFKGQLITKDGHESDPQTVTVTYHCDTCLSK